MPSFSTTAINLNPNAAVGVVGFCLIHSPLFAMPTLRYNLRNFLVATVILLLFFFITVFPYKTLLGAYVHLIPLFIYLFIFFFSATQLKMRTNVTRPEAARSGSVKP